MAKGDKYHPNYQKLYPGVELTPEVMEILKQSDRKQEYMEVDLKSETFLQDQNARIARFIPSREDSYDRLCDEEMIGFPSSEVLPEDEAIHNDELERLRKARAILQPDEQALLKALFDDGLSEREYAKQLGISQKAVNKRWHKVRSILKKEMKI